SSAWGVLHERDVLIAVAGRHDVCDGPILLREDDRVSFTHLVSQHLVGESIELGILRDGQPMSVTLTLKRHKPLVARPRHDVRPTYFIFAGLVFMPLSYDYMASWDWKDVDARFKHYYSNELPSARRKEVVIINQVLAHDANVGYHQLRGAVVDRINGVVITEMADVLTALASPSGAFHVIEIDHHAGRGDSSDYSAFFGTHIVLAAAGADEATREILARYGIASDRSADLASGGVA
ncbi:hypothetical protein L6R52_32930, partial [Myxococcota bacterium]|nr:hypothetical protein [Myxococcota bacterium]